MSRSRWADSKTAGTAAIQSELQRAAQSSLAKLSTGRFWRGVSKLRMELTCLTTNLYFSLMANSDWRLVGTKLIYHHPTIDVFWSMPDGFTMPSASALSLAEFLLLRPYNQSAEIVPRSSPPGDRIAVAFSGGIDSAAALMLLPEAIPVYTRVARVTGRHVIENAQLAVEEVGGLTIVTNYDDFGLETGKKKGFYGHGGFSITAVLLSDHLGLKTIAEGQVLETAYLYKGGHGTGFSPTNYSRTMDAFAMSGLQFCLPCAGLTEVSTTRIAGANFRYVMSCMRGRGGEPCLACMKCYRKEALRGSPIPTCAEVEDRLAKPVIAMLPGLLWAKEHEGLRHPVLDTIEGKDISWADKWYTRSMELVPPELHGHILTRLKELGIEPLKDEAPLLGWSSAIATQ